MNDRAFRVYKLATGTVIDHIPAGRGIRVIALLGLDTPKEDIVTLGINMESKTLGRKDVVKIEDQFLTEETLQRLCLIAPTATINILKDHVVEKKMRVTVPKRVEGLVECPNNNCITNHQREPTVFTYEEPRFHCSFCERSYTPDEINLR